MKRLFRGLRQAPDPRYDAVIIGAGIGGLTPLPSGMVMKR